MWHLDRSPATSRSCSKPPRGPCERDVTGALPQRQHALRRGAAIAVSYRQQKTSPRAVMAGRARSNTKRYLVRAGALDGQMPPPFATDDGTGGPLITTVARSRPTSASAPASAAASTIVADKSADATCRGACILGFSCSDEDQRSAAVRWGNRHRLNRRRRTRYLHRSRAPGPDLTPRTRDDERPSTAGVRMRCYQERLATICSTRAATRRK